jgi:exoribonuclease-2
LLSPEVLLARRPDRRAWGAAWLLLVEEASGLGLVDFTDLVFGCTEPAAVAACWLALMGEQTLFRLRQGEVSSRGLHDLRGLRRERRLAALRERREGEWQELLRRREPVNRLQQSALVCDRLDQLKRLAAGELDSEHLDPQLRQSLVGLHLGQDRGELRHLLVCLGQWDRHHLVSMGGTTWSAGFTAEHLAEADRLLSISALDQPSDDQRLDLTGQRCLTIDDDDTRDIDDGLALERRPDGGLRLWIHVADPGRLVAVDSLLDREARRRGSSLYLAAGPHPMFPEVLTTGPFSLRAGVRTAAWSTWIELLDDGAIGHCGLVRSWVRPRLRLSYADADDLIDLAPPEEADLVAIDRLLQRRRSWRHQHGALQLDLPEGRIRCQGQQPVLDISEPGPSRQLVAEAMILAGSATARFGQEHALALPYRSQLPAELPPAAQLDALPEGAVRFAAIKRCLSRGMVGTQPAPHFSLGLPAYVQATSPIRRYGDLVVQRQIEAQLTGQQPLDAAALQALIDAFDGAVREGLAIAREDQRHWQQVWFEANRGGQWRAQFLRWLRPQDRLGLVRLEELAMDLAADCPAQAHPGEALLVKVVAVDSLRDQLRLQASFS